MKKILFSLMALVCSMSMNAQIIKVMKNGQADPVATYTGSEYYVVFEEQTAPTTTGTAKATIAGSEVDVNWVQLWENGPKFAEYNIGAVNNKAEDYGNYYCWGSSINKDSDGAYKDGESALSGVDDTATNLWGSNWRMPTQAEFQTLLDNCDVEWTTVNGVNGRKFTGKEAYASNSVFFPAAGYCNYGNVDFQGMIGGYWSSTPYNSNSAFDLYFNAGGQSAYADSRNFGKSVRAVLAEE